MKAIFAAVSAIIFSINGEPIDFQPSYTIQEQIAEVVTDQECETVFTDYGLLKFEKESINMLAKLVWGEARGIDSTDEKAAVVWCVTNRVDAGYGSIEEVITAPNQFTGYRASNPVTDELYDLALDVLTRWKLEQLGDTDVGRVLPKEYLFFAGDGSHNIFRTSYRGGTRWDWSLPSPYV